MAAGKAKEDMLVKVMMGSVVRDLDWPRGRPTPAAVADTSLNLSHVRLIMVICEQEHPHSLLSIQLAIGSRLLQHVTTANGIPSHSS